MPSSLGNLPPYQSIPYHLAALPLQTQALRLIQDVFQGDFPAVTASQWQHVVASCYPVLGVAGSSVELREEDLTRVATYLRVMYMNTDSALQLAYCSSSHHVAHKLNSVSRRVGVTLAQGAALEVSEPHETLALYRSALESLVGNDVIAERICLAFTFRDPDRIPPRRVYAPSVGGDTLELAAATPSASPVFPPSSPKRAIEELPDQWAHLQSWFKQTNDPARPWSVSGIARQLKLGQSVVRALLTAPKGTPGFSRTAFSKVQLRRLQRYFKSYGYRCPS